jgi:hypothetical protein
MSSQFVIGSTSASLNAASKVTNGFSKVFPVVGVAVITLGPAALMFMGARALTSRAVIALEYSEGTAKVTGIAVGVLAGAATFFSIWSVLLISAFFEELNRTH